MSKIGAGKSPGGSPVKSDGAAAAGQADGLSEGLRVHRGDQHAVHATGGFLHLGDHIAGSGVDDDLGAQAGGQGELGVIDVDGHHPQPHRPRILHGRYGPDRRCRRSPPTGRAGCRSP